MHNKFTPLGVLLLSNFYVMNKDVDKIGSTVSTENIQDLTEVKVSLFIN